MSMNAQIKSLIAKVASFDGTESTESLKEMVKQSLELTKLLHKRVKIFEGYERKIKKESLK